jgi:hypothetical protein
MAVLAASNVAAVLKDYPVWRRADMQPFLEPDPPEAAPSIINAAALNLPTLNG